MAYRNGTYIAFHADGKTDPTASDIKFFNLLKAWTAKKDDDFSFINSHEKTAAVSDKSKDETLRKRLVTRLNNSKNLVLIIGKTTKFDTDWVPFEIEHAIDKCKIPIIVAYASSIVETDKAIKDPKKLSKHWPKSLAKRINDGTASAIHIPFRKAPIKDAISQFDINKKPRNKGLGVYSDKAYKEFDIELA